ncbi:MAG TPA: TetR/AcrR family transcriptional regulator [Pseudonocardiaceae bacterium]|jgi:TetR/AcrR family transcriptional repressor of mexJK operon|nr:TetR/AcrR family transcriptional regulator [Pseudonocardiaceae bacterium]
MDELIVRIGRHSDADALDGPSRKRAAIVQAATDLFLRRGYQDTSTDQIATAAAVSKQTVYNQFGDKQRLFTEIILGVTATAERFAGELSQEAASLRTADDLEPGLRALAQRYLASVINPRVLALRRLMIGEAHRFPDLAAAYYERAPARVLAALADLFERLGERGLLTVDDPRLAAEHFAFLVLGNPLDHGMFHIDTEFADSERLALSADRAVMVFLAAYRRH